MIKVIVTCTTCSAVYKGFINVRYHDANELEIFVVSSCSLCYSTNCAEVEGDNASEGRG